MAKVQLTVIVKWKKVSQNLRGTSEAGNNSFGLVDFHIHLPCGEEEEKKKINLTTPGLIFLSVRTKVCLMLGSKEVGGGTGC